MTSVKRRTRHPATSLVTCQPNGLTKKSSFKLWRVSSESSLRHHYVTNNMKKQVSPKYIPADMTSPTISDVFYNEQEDIPRKEEIMQFYKHSSSANLQDYGKSPKPGRGNNDGSVYFSWPRKWNRGRPHLGTKEPYSVAQAWMTQDSDNSTRGSQDSLEETNDVTRNKQTNTDAGRDKVKKGKKSKLRKSLKSVGKSPSTPLQDAGELAERRWIPKGDCSWSNMSGRKVEIGSTRLQSLSELECDALQKVSLQRLHSSDLGITITVPKDDSKILNRKMSMKKRYGRTLPIREKNKEKDTDHVFGIPLVNVVENDQLLRLQKSASFASSLDLQSQEALLGVAPNIASSASSKSSSCSGSTTSINNPQTSKQEVEDRRLFTRSSSVDNVIVTDGEMDNIFNKDSTAESNIHAPAPISLSSSAARPLKRRGAIAAESINEIDPYQSQLLEALSLSVSGNNHSQRREMKRSLLPPTMAQVPYVVQKCCDHITKYGLDVTGIFRIAGSKKRVKQLREEFDRGLDVTIDEDYNPHDVAALLKEFFRDLPEALLTKDLYPAFIETAKLPKEERLSSLRSLVWLLPHTNRDTLHTLLNFLAIVAAHSGTTTDDAGNEIEGNKMTTANLAMIFGPNILHRYKKTTQSSSENQYQVQGLEKPEESTWVIKVIEDLITDQLQLYQIPKEEHDQMLRVLKETDPEAVDFLLRRKAANHMREKSKLLATTSSSPQSSRRMHQENYSDSNVKNGRSRFHSASDDAISNPDDVITHPSMRLSYQQATGHVVLGSYDGKKDKPSRLKFKRPFFKKTMQDNDDSSDMDERSEVTQSGRLEDNQTIADTEQLTPGGIKKEESFTKDLDQSRGSTSSIFSLRKMQDRSVSFTEDELEEILGVYPNKSKKSSTNDFEEVKLMMEEKQPEADCKDSKNNEYTTSGAKKSLQCDTTEEATSSSTSGESVGYGRQGKNSPDLIKRRGGFSLVFRPVSANTELRMKEDTLSKSASSNISAIQEEDVFRVDEEFVNHEVDGDPLSYEEDQININSLERQVDDTTVSGGRSKRRNPEEREKITTNISYNDVNNNSRERKKDVKKHLQLLPKTLEQMNIALNQGQRSFISSIEQEKESYADEQRNLKQKSDEGRRRLPSGLSPRLHRKYGGASSNPDLCKQLELNRVPTKKPRSRLTNEKLLKLSSDQTSYVSSSDSKHKEEVPVVMTTHSTSPTLPSFMINYEGSKMMQNNRVNEGHRNIRKINERRYSKDDLSLARSIRSSFRNHELMTSHALDIPSHRNLATNIPNNYFKNVRPPVTRKLNNLTSPWKESVNDGKNLSETLV